MIKHALRLASKGFFVFPLKPNSKEPLIMNFPGLATRDEITIKNWWKQWPDANVAIYAGAYGSGSEALVIVDVDNKNGKNGDDDVANLEIQGKMFPITTTQITPTGGKHFIYKTKVAVRQSASKIAKGIDIRSRGGYVVGAGSTLNGKEYVIDENEIAECEGWLIEECGRRIEKEKKECRADINQKRAIEKGIEYLEKAPLAIEGEGGNATTFKVAAQLRTIGVSHLFVTELLLDHWNGRCSPPWDESKLDEIVGNAYRYASGDFGEDSPEYQFADIQTSNESVPKQHEGSSKDESRDDPNFGKTRIDQEILKLNKDHAFILSGGGHHVLWETFDARGHKTVVHLVEQSFHKKFEWNGFLVEVGDKKIWKQVSKEWMRSKKRRDYDGFCFRPLLKTDPRFYNLWQGFAFEPIGKDEKVTDEMRKSLDDFLDHAFENVCGNDQELYEWLISFFAHLVQKPYEKPLVALVFKGGKGVGKNALVETVGALLGAHFFVTADIRHLLGNFNQHLENNLCIVFDEATWGGDKALEGKLKDLITGKHHNIEPKGRPIFEVDNCSRVVIIGNEDWLVPATSDERRYAIFNVGDGRKQDVEFFTKMREGMENGGYRLLLKFLQQWDISKFNRSIAPKTEGLLDQKHNSLSHFDLWLFDSLKDGKWFGRDFDGWEVEIKRDELRSSYVNYMNTNKIYSRPITDNLFGRKLKHLFDVKTSQHSNSRYYVFPSLDKARLAWEKFIGDKEDWNS